MNVTQCLRSPAARFFALTLVAASAASLQAASTQQGWAKVRYVVGKPQLVRGGGAGQTLERNMIVKPGDVVKCDQFSHADLALGLNNGSVQVSPNSELEITKLTYGYTGLELVHETDLKLNSGVLYGQVHKMSAASKYTVRTPRGVAGIRGTRYRIAANGDVTVTEGTVVYAVPQPDGTVRTVTINAGETYDAAGGTVRPATDQEIRDTNDGSTDATNHGGTGPDPVYDPLKQLTPDTVEDPVRRTLPGESYVSPTLPLN